MFLYWGPDLTCFYNDAFRISLGENGKHPHILGMPGHLAWSEIWQTIGPLLHNTLATGESIWNENMLLPIHRNGVLEDVYWTFSYTPVIAEQGRIGGILGTGMEVTAQIAARRSLTEKADLLSLVIDAAEMGFWDIDLSRGTVNSNERLRSLFGFASHTHPNREQFFDRIAEKDRQRVRDASEKSRSPGGDGLFDIEFTISIPGLPDRQIRAAGKTTCDPAGTPVHFSGMVQDVTQKNQLMAGLEASQRSLIGLFEDAPVAIATIGSDEALTFQTANRFYRELVGRNPDQLLGKPLLEALPELKGQGFDQLLKDVLQSQVPFTAYEVPVELHHQGQPVTVYLNFSYIPRTTTNGVVNGILVTATDVTVQVRARRAVEEKEAEFRSLIEAAPFPIGVYIGPEFEIAQANPAIIAIYGKTSDVIGKKYLDLNPELVDQGIAEQLREVYSTGKPFYSGTRRVDILTNGARQIYYFHYSFVPLFDSSGKVYGILNTGADVTELELARQRARDAESSLLSAIELAELADWSVDLEHRLLRLSPRLKQWTGILKDEIPLAVIFDYVPAENRPAVAASYGKVFRSASLVSIDIEHPLINPETGSRRFVHVRGQGVEDARTGKFRVTGTMQDVTEQRASQWELERKVAEHTADLAAANAALQLAITALEQKNMELKYSNDELAQYAYVTSHDLQEPLRKIRFYSNAIQEQFPLVPGANAYFQKIIQSAGRMTQLIQDLLTFSRLLDTGEAMQPVDLTQVMKAVVDDFELAIHEKDAIVRVEEMPVVTGMALQLNQLLQNLLSNALKFSDPGRTPVIRITARLVPAGEVATFFHQPQDVSYYEIAVTDNGIGFEPEYASYIFEPFKRLHGRDAFTGSGIGLALCRRIAANHRGYIYAQSTPGAGSRFCIILPAGEGKVATELQRGQFSSGAETINAIPH